jgi:hypothetical protein
MTPQDVQEKTLFNVCHPQGKCNQETSNSENLTNSSFHHRQMACALLSIEMAISGGAHSCSYSSPTTKKENQAERVARFFGNFLSIPVLAIGT